MADLPVGIVTYLFTDIQGSTSLWEQMPGAMKVAVARHFALLQEAIAAHDGHGYKIVGDAFQVAFSQPIQAVQAAVCAQRLLESEAWGETGPLRVRMGIHSGPGELTADGSDYAVSHTLNRIARIMSAGHGGQILISAATVELLHGQLPPEIQFKNLGMHHLRGLSLPERIYQVLAPGLQVEFPPLISSSPPRHNLPAAMTPFVGREVEIREVCRLLTNPACRLLTLVGPGGIGKTRLALRAAGDLLEDFPQGIWFAPLVGVNSLAALVPALASAVHFHFYSHVHPRQQLLDFLREKRLLLILDNFEHLVKEAVLLDEILATAPGVKLLATSRQALGLQVEWLYPLEGLEFPLGRVHLEKPLEMYSAIQLFVLTANRVHPGYRPQPDLACITGICQLLEGMPLAIELSAIWIKILPCERILAEVEKGLDILAAHQQNIPERQHSIRAVFEYSWNQLSKEERMALQMLSVFWGGFRLEAAEQVAGATLAHLATLMANLMDHGLLRVAENDRYHIHELLRQFIAEILKTDPETRAAVRARHSAYYLSFLAERQTGIRGQQQRAVLNEVDQENDNLRAAWDWAVRNERMDLVDMGLDSLYTYYWKRGRYLEGEKACREAMMKLRQLPQPDTLLLARLISRQGHFRYALGPYEEAQKLLETGLGLATELQEPGEIAFNLAIQGVVRRELGNYHQANQCFEESLALYRQIGDQAAQAYVLTQLGEAHMLSGSIEKSIDCQLESLEISRQLGLPDRMAYALDQLGAAMVFSYDPISSQQYYQEAMQLFSELNDPLGIAMALGGFGLCLSDQFNLESSHNQQALAYLEQSLALFREIGHRRQIGLHLWAMIYPLVKQNEISKAKAIALEAVEIGEEIQDPVILLFSLEHLVFLTAREYHFEEARQYLSRALEPAHKLGGSALGKIVMLRGALKFMEGRESLEEKRRGLELIALGCANMEEFYRNYAYDLYLAALEAEAPSEIVAAAQERGKALNIQTGLKPFAPSGTSSPR